MEKNGLKKILERKITCPYCKKTVQVDLENYMTGESSTEKENGMGQDLVYYFDTDKQYECSNCKSLVKIEGWIREYPIGVLDSEKINVKKQDK